MKDSTIIRIKVPAHLYESVKKQLKLQEGKNDFGMPGSTTIKEKKSSSGDSKPKKKTESKKADSGKEKKTEAKKAKAPKEEAKTPNDGMKKVEGKILKLSELKKMHEILGEKIAKMEGRRRDYEGFDEPSEVEYDREMARSRRYNDEWKYEDPSYVKARQQRAQDIAAQTPGTVKKFNGAPLGM